MTYEKKRKMSEHPSRYSASDKALYRLSMCDEEMQRLGETIEAEQEKLQKRIKELEEGLGECCHMFEWCDTRYGQLLKGKD